MQLQNQPVQNQQVIYEARITLSNATGAAKPSGSLVYYDPATNQSSTTLVARHNDSLRFTLYQNGSQVSDADLVVIAQYGRIKNSATKEKSKSPFYPADRAIYLDPGDNWELDLKHPTPGPSQGIPDYEFEYCVVVLIQENSVAIAIDPSIIIRPN